MEWAGPVVSMVEIKMDRSLVGKSAQKRPLNRTRDIQEDSTWAGFKATV
jgi:hypothetical protein